MRVGIVGCGVISKVYFESGKRFEALEVVGCSDVDEVRAKEAAATHGVRAFGSTEALLADDEVELVVNLTPPLAHRDISLAVLGSGKHRYTEKPLGISRSEGSEIVGLAARTGLGLGSAPDTFLGGGLQTCRRLVDDGAVGVPVAATAFLMGKGPEGWHPNPEFFFQRGAGPLFDVGPYYITALVHLLGPVARVVAYAKTAVAERVIGKGPRSGTRFAVEVPTHVTGLVEFAGGAVATLITSFDVWASQLPRMEVYGTDGTLGVPNPNTFGGPVIVAERGVEGWREVPAEGPYVGQSRGIGAADLAAAVRTGRQPRAGGELAYHVLDVMEALLESAESGMWVSLDSTCSRPAPLATGLADGEID
jgi:predicted dehydrogenase